MLAQLTRSADPNKKSGAKSGFTHAPRASSTTHRMPDEDIHRSQFQLGLLEMEPHVGAGARLRRCSISRLIHGIAIETSGGERLAETKQHFFRAAVSMSQKRNGMLTRRGGGKSKRGGVCCQHYFFYAEAPLNKTREYRPNNQGGEGCCNNPMSSASVHGFFLVMQNESVLATASKGPALIAGCSITGLSTGARSS